ncbi:uncharacterized protein K452DRAFT_308022 [Aplosporella prunicola CBS 121167]|uniref:Uncharacterized protein n=1 Tax=Aplosporella prunicola CBS 121167 TaxID=1176127 RepID=A0A6A6BFJ0_9PEZI|nr:uncharacterized protein K452DRAFT_308022 [Aplosporella prunicola CBS 121167]KAF2142328.1 hypothetical protein K452DRAFT_308022 [Aplosporella prunicola CBS 121167]
MPSSRPSGNRSQTQRLPAPQLFVGPPSRNDSSNSLVPPPASGVATSRAPLTRQRSLLEGSSPSDKSETRPLASSSRPQQLQQSQPQQQQQQQQTQQAQVEQQSAERTDAIWAEMQNTLEEVELSAVNGTHVFRPGHSHALEELRIAQIALAQAWARSEAEDEDAAHGAAAASAELQRPLAASNVLAGDRAEKLGSSGGATAGNRPRSGTDTSAKSQLEEDTENDILLARKRREANDRYFQRVNAGVLDVVAKLEEVAKAMKGVEQESKEIWGDGESVETDSYRSK